MLGSSLPENTGSCVYRRTRQYPESMKAWLQITVVALSAVVVGAVAYPIALGLGATHSACSGTSSSGYCDTRAGAWALVALAIGVLIGGAVSVWGLRLRKWTGSFPGMPLVTGDGGGYRP